MKTNTFKYPFGIQFSKILSLFFILIGLSLLPIIVSNYEPKDFSSYLEYLLAMISIPFILVVGNVYYLYSWSDITITKEGISADYLWMKLKIPWNGIKELRRVGSDFTGLAILLTEKDYLTFFHRFYSFFSVGSIQPGLHIHPQIINANELFKIIRIHLKNG